MPIQFIDDIIIVDADSDNSSNNEEENSTYSTYDYDYSDDYDDIFMLEETFIDSDKHNNQYLLGISSDEDEYELFACGVTASTFFKFPYKRIINYLFYYSTVYIPKPKLNIIKLHISNDDCYISINKTYWLRLIQKHWKKLYQIKKNLLLKRQSIQAIHYFAIHGKYPSEYYKFPKLEGMMSCYAK